MNNISNCPICNSKTKLLFEVEIFGINRKLLECLSSNCKHSFFGNVDWLDQAYSSAIADLDTGAVRRCLSVRKIIASLITINTNNATVLDYGGGSGLLTRLLRDLGINCYHYDKYCNNVYAGPFGGIDSHYDVVTMVEVIEHLLDPVTELEGILKKYSPRIVMATTVLRPDVLDKSWWYLTPSTGQHINFYSANSLKIMAHSLGYDVLISGTTVIFYNEKISGLRKILLNISLNRYLKYVVYIYRSIIYRSSNHKDFQQIKVKK